VKFRVCHKCHRNLPMTHKYFSVDKSRKHGLNYKCRDCGKKSNVIWSRNNRFKLNKKRRKYQKDKLMAGLCSCCISPRIQHSSKFCERHWYHKMSRKHFGTSMFWNKLKQLAASQSYMCPYTNTKLIPGLNMSLDHKMPTSRNRTKKFDISNLQWVTYNVNLAKNNLTHEEFLRMCERACINFNIFNLDIKKVG